MDLIVAILILLGFLLVVKNNGSRPESSSSTLLTQLKDLQKRVGALEYEVRRLSSGGSMPLKSEDIHKPALEQPQELVAGEKVVSAAMQSRVEDKAEEKVEEKVVTEKVVKPKMEFESFFTSNLLNKVGVLALIIGMGFFLTYTFDQSWVSPVVKVLTSTLFAVLFLFGAAWFNKTETYKVFVQGIAGAGIAVFYLSIFAAYSYYHLFNYPIAFVLMLATATIAFHQALKYNSVATAVLGLVGGFVTPFMMSKGGGNAVDLLTYLLFLNIWTVALAYKKPEWKAVENLGLFATYISYFMLQGSSYYSENWGIAVLFLTLIWAIYLGLDISKIERKIKTFSLEGNFLNVANGLIFYSGIYFLLNYNNHDSVSFATALIALAYLVIGLKVYYKYDRLDDYLKQNIYAFVSLVAIATNLSTEGFIKAIVFALEARLLLYFGTQFQKPYIWKASSALFSFAIVALMFNSELYTYAAIQNFTPVFNLRFLTFMTIIGLSLYCIQTLKTVKESEGLIAFYRYCWTTLLFVLFSIEVGDFMTKIASGTPALSFNKSMIQVIIWMSYSTRLLVNGLKLNIRPFKVIGILGTTIAVCSLLIHGISFHPTESFNPIFNLRFVAFALTASGLMYVSKQLKALNMSESGQKFLDYTWGLMLFGLVNFEINDYFDKVGGLENAKQLVISGGWLIYSIIAMYFGILKRIKPLRYIALWVLGVTVLKVFIYDLSFLDQLGRVISFMGLGVILLALSFFYQKYSVQIKKLINEDIIK